MTPRIQTQRMELIAGTSVLAAAASRDRTELAKLLDAEIPKAWPHPSMAQVLGFFNAELIRDPRQAGWLNWYWVRTASESDTRQRVVIGAGGFKGPPAADGSVEIGYAVLDPFQRRGYATEAVQALVSWALLDPRVTRVIAETYADHASSIRVLMKCGFAFVGSAGEDGVLLFARTCSA